ncbi:unnamed protein product [Polarella glacialis]|uniref:Uncharacterized protein n=1 Tax=Polarella glacialis TaxID=89957 RepID=A0A813LVI0_POLGL|nr:unnamed protein product [Polarella glacialis]
MPYAPGPLSCGPSRKEEVWPRGTGLASPDSGGEEGLQHDQIRELLLQLSFSTYQDRDPCACNLGYDYFMHVSSQLRQGQMVRQTCTADAQTLWSQTASQLIVGTCFGGQVADYFAELQDCILKEHTTQSVIIWDFLFRMAVVGGSCLDISVWAVSQEALLQGFGLFAALLADSGLSFWRLDSEARLWFLRTRFVITSNAAARFSCS